MTAAAYRQAARRWEPRRTTAPQFVTTAPLSSATRALGMHTFVLCCVLISGAICSLLKYSSLLVERSLSSFFSFYAVLTCVQPYTLCSHFLSLAVVTLWENGVPPPLWPHITRPAE